MGLGFYPIISNSMIALGKDALDMEDLLKVYESDSHALVGASVVGETSSAAWRGRTARQRAHY